jgi:hypothetical protein
VLTLKQFVASKETMKQFSHTSHKWEVNKYSRPVFSGKNFTMETVAT